MASRFSSAGSVGAAMIAKLWRILDDAIQAVHLAVGTAMCVGWVLGVHFIFDRLGIGYPLEWAVSVFGGPAFVVLVALAWWCWPARARR